MCIRDSDMVCIPSTQRSEAQFLCACVCPNHSNSSTGLQHHQQQQCSFTSVVPIPVTAAGKPCSYCCGGQDVSHSSSNTVDTTLSGNVMIFLLKYQQLNCYYISGHFSRTSSTVFGFLMQCWYSYSYNNRYVFGQGDMTCLRSSKRTLKPSKMKYPLGKHPNNFCLAESSPGMGSDPTRTVTRRTSRLCNPQNTHAPPRRDRGCQNACLYIPCLLYTSPSPRD